MRVNRRLLLFLALVLAAGVLTLQRRRVEPAGGVAQRTLDAVTRPVEWAVTGVRDRTLGIGRWITDLVHLRRENLDLRYRVIGLEAALREREEDRLENERLRRLLALPERGDVREITARVVGIEHTNWFRTIRIDRGLRDGVIKNSPVITGDGVVGHVIEVTPRRATVLLLLDANCRVAAILQDSREQGLLEGRLDEDLLLTYIDRRTDVQVGEAVITSGMGGIYPKGLLLGRVTEVQPLENEIFLLAHVKPSVNFGRLEDVIVLLPMQDDATFDGGDLAAS